MKTQDKYMLNFTTLLRLVFVWWKMLIFIIFDTSSLLIYLVKIIPENVLTRAWGGCGGVRIKLRPSVCLSVRLFVGHANLELSFEYQVEKI